MDNPAELIHAQGPELIIVVQLDEHEGECIFATRLDLFPVSDGEDVFYIIPRARRRVGFEPLEFYYHLQPFRGYAGLDQFLADIVASSIVEEPGDFPDISLWIKNAVAALFQL